MKSCGEERAESPTGSLTYVYSVWRQCVKSISPLQPAKRYNYKQLGEEDSAIHIFKNGSGMKVIRAAESVNKRDGSLESVSRAPGRIREREHR